MCFGGRGSSTKDTRRVSHSDSLEKGKPNSILSDPRSRTGMFSTHSSVMSSTGPSTHTGGPSMYSNPPMTSPRAGTSNESEPLPPEMTAKSPKKGSTESPRMQYKSRDRKSTGMNIDTWRSTKDEETLKNVKESHRDREMTIYGKDATEVSNSEWSVMGKAPTKRKDKAGTLRSLFKSRAPAPSRPPPPPSIPSIPTIPSQPLRPSPIIPSPSITPPTFPSLANQSDEKTAINNQTLRTQRTMMDEETISRMQITSVNVKNQKDISYEVDTRAPVQIVPSDDGRKLMEESKKLSVREDLKSREEPTALMIPEPSTKREISNNKSTTIEITQMKG